MYFLGQASRAINGTAMKATLGSLGPHEPTTGSCDLKKEGRAAMAVCEVCGNDYAFEL